MKKLNVVLIGVLFCSCDSVWTNTPVASDYENESVGLSLEEVISIADGHFGLSRSSVDSYEIDYITLSNEKSTISRSSCEDTLAYIVNRKGDNGFIIVGNTRETNPVLAFSDEGNFTVPQEGDEIIKTQFIDRISGFINNPPILPPDSLDIEPVERPYEDTIRYPKLHVNLGQRSPYDKYVIQEHPGCPTGCTAVASIPNYDYGQMDFISIKIER